MSQPPPHDPAGRDARMQYSNLPQQGLEGRPQQDPMYGGGVHPQQNFAMMRQGVPTSAIQNSSMLSGNAMNVASAQARVSPTPTGFPQGFQHTFVDREGAGSAGPPSRSPEPYHRGGLSIEPPPLGQMSAGGHRATGVGVMAAPPYPMRTGAPGGAEFNWQQQPPSSMLPASNQQAPYAPGANFQDQISPSGMRAIEQMWSLGNARTIGAQGGLQPIGSGGQQLQGPGVNPSPSSAGYADRREPGPQRPMQAGGNSDDEGDEEGEEDNEQEGWERRSGTGGGGGAAYGGGQEDDAMDGEWDPQYSDGGAGARRRSAQSAASGAGGDTGSVGGDDGPAVCAPGAEQTGRWTKAEHEIFLKALKKYGKEWKRVASMVKTRTVVQTRTHAQKYFQKLQKSHAFSGAADRNSDQGGDSDENPTAGLKLKRRQSGGNDSNASSGKKARHTRGASHGYDSNASASLSPYRGGMRGRSAMADQGSSDGDNDDRDERQQQPQGLYIVPPDALQPGARRYPTPSPAAQGSRKQTELAVAEMLAGAGARTYFPSGGSGPSARGGAGGYTSQDRQWDNSNTGGGPSLRITNPDELGGVRPVGGGGRTPFTPWERDLTEKEMQAKPKLPTEAQAKERSKMIPPGSEGAIPRPPSVPPRYSPVPPAVPEIPNRLHQLIIGLNLDEMKVYLEDLARVEAEKKSKIDADAAALALLAPDVMEIGTADQPSGGLSINTTTGDIVASVPRAAMTPTSGIDQLSLNSSASDTGAVCGSPPPTEKSLIETEKLVPLAASTDAKMEVEAENSDNNGLSTAGPGGVKLPPSLLSTSADEGPTLLEIVNAVDTYGFTPLICAASLEGQGSGENSAIACREVLAHGALPDGTDANNNTAAHWAAFAGNTQAINLLARCGANVNFRNNDGDTPLHFASRCGQPDVVEALLRGGAFCHVRNKDSKSPLDVAAENVRRDVPLELERAIHLREKVREIIFRMEPRTTTLVLHHPQCLGHKPRSSRDWECPERVTAILAKLNDANYFRNYELDISSDFDMATVEALSRVHTPDYIRCVSDLSKKLEAEGRDSVPLTPMIQKNIMGKTTNEIKPSDACDTSFSAGSLYAARRAAGAVKHAVDSIMAGRHRNAFCCVRPPGHHAGPNGLLESAVSCGFCVFNNVAVGAMHALEQHALQRVAIVDFDAHHGNGTEEIVRSYPDPSKILFYSVHLYDKGNTPAEGEFYPGSGGIDDTAHNIINVPIQPLWKAPQAVAASTRSRSTNTTGQQMGAVAGRHAFRDAITQRLLAALRAFNPQLIFMSMGFDAVEGDVGNARHGGHVLQGCDLTPSDYAWMTARVQEVADMCCGGRVVSVLEGGYGRSQDPAQMSNNGSSTATGSRLPNLPGQHSHTHGSQPASSSANSQMPAPTGLPPSKSNSRNAAGAGYQSVDLAHSLDRSMLAEAAAAHVKALVDPYRDTVDWGGVTQSNRRSSGGQGGV